MIQRAIRGKARRRDELPADAAAGVGNISIRPAVRGKSFLKTNSANANTEYFLSGKNVGQVSRDSRQRDPTGDLREGKDKLPADAAASVGNFITKTGRERQIIPENELGKREHRVFLSGKNVGQVARDSRQRDPTSDLREGKDKLPADAAASVGNIIIRPAVRVKSFLRTNSATANAECTNVA